MKTKSMLTFKAKKGMVIAEDILTSSGQLLIPKNTVFDTSVKNTLFSHAILSFQTWVDDDEPDDVQAITTTDNSDVEISINAIPTKITEDIKPVKLKVSENIHSTKRITQDKQYRELIERTLVVMDNPDFKHYDKLYDESLSFFKEDLVDIVFNNKKINLNKMLDIPLQIINSNVPTMNVLDMLINMTKKTDPVFCHSFNVSLICGVIGEWLKLPSADIQMLMLSALLHDIGKLMLPDNHINKPDKLTEQELMIVRTHPILGYNAIKDQDIDPRIKACVLMHHEKCDGSGYPSKMTREMLPEFVKILTIADVYDAMVCDRIYRVGFSPFEVISLFESEGLQKYDTRILLTFLKRIGDAYLHYNVLLSDGSKGKIVAINSNYPSKPIISVNNKYIDLSKEQNVSIIGII